MSIRSYPARLLLLATILSVLMMAFCVAIATWLNTAQSTTAEVLRENIGSRREADSLEESLTLLLGMHENRDREVDPVHQRVVWHLERLGELADKPREQELTGQIRIRFADYIDGWDRSGHRTADPATVERLRDCMALCQQLVNFNSVQIDDSQDEHRRALSRMTLGLTAVGCVGSLSGMVPGFGLARSLRRSIHEFLVRVQGATDLLGAQTSSAVVVPDGDPLDVGGRELLHRRDPQPSDLGDSTAGDISQGPHGGRTDRGRPRPDRSRTAPHRNVVADADRRRAPRAPRPSRDGLDRPDRVISARTAAEGLESVSREAPDVIIQDVHLPDADRNQTLDRIRPIDARTPAIVIAGHGTTDLAIEAMKKGAFDYLLKPLRYEKLTEVVQLACQSSRAMKEPTVVPGVDPLAMPVYPESGDALVGQCPQMQDIYKSIGRVAATNATVLILGESGTGKESIARAIYQHSTRADKQFLAINCGAIPETLVESELFGHEKGAFTGAERRRVGRFEQCDGGTLFLDEIAEMPLLAQVKLLRLLQERAFERVGGTETVRVDVRIIAATNADPEKQVAAGRFRSDLYFRLNVFTIHLPPLRERTGDVVSLTDYYLNRYSREFSRPIPILPAETRKALEEYRWPGNVRELQSVIEAAWLRMSGSILLPEFLNLPAPKAGVDKPATATNADEPTAPVPTESDLDTWIEQQLEAGSRDLYVHRLELMERRLLTRVLQKTGGNQLRAAEILGITRGSLRHKLRVLGLTVEKTVTSDEDEG